MKNIRRTFPPLIICSILLLSMIFPPLSLITQAETNSENIPWKESVNIPQNKEWKINFNKKIDPTSVNADSVYVTDPDGKKTGVIPTVNSTKEAILIPAPSNGYRTGLTYTLHITTKVKEIQGKNLKRSVSKQFTIKDQSHDDSALIQPYKSSFEIMNTSSTEIFVQLASKADISIYRDNSELETYSLETNYVHIPQKTIAIVSFDQEVSSPFLEVVTGITYQKTEEPAFSRVHLTADSAVAFTKVSDEHATIQFDGGDFFYTDSNNPNDLRLRELPPYGTNHINLQQSITQSIQPKSGSKINIHAPYRSFSFKELPTLFADEYLVEPTNTAVLTTEKTQTSILVDKESAYEYVHYTGPYGRIDQGTSEAQNYVKSIRITNDSQYVMTNKGVKSYSIAGLTGSFIVQNRDETASKTEILQPQASKIVTNGSSFRTEINITGKGTLDYATYNKNGSSDVFDQLTIRIDSPRSLAFENSQKIVMTNTGTEPLQLSYPSAQHQSEDTTMQALRNESLEPGATSIWKNTFPISSTIKVIGNGHIEFAQYNAIGDVQSFGTEEVSQQYPYRMYLGANNASVITNSGSTPLQLIGPENIYTVHKSNERALLSEVVESGNSLVVQTTKTSATRALVVAEGNYDFAEYQGIYLRDFNKKEFPPSFKSKETFYIADELLITNKAEKPLTIYVPSSLTNLTSTDESALLEKTINPGESITWMNNSYSGINMILSGSGMYHYVSKDRNTAIISENRRTLNPAWTNSELLPSNGSLEITNEGNEPITIYGPARFLTSTN